VATNPAAGQIAVDGRVGKLTISSGTTPSIDEVTDEIENLASELCLLVDDYGIDSDALTLSGNKKIYRLLRGKLARAAAAFVHATNQRGDTSLAQRYMGEWNGFIAGLKANPGQYLGDSHTNTLRTEVTTGDEDEADATWERGMDL
jgi:hypothetical protein